MAARLGITLMTPDSIELVQRYITSYNKYFGARILNLDRILAMVVHPLLPTQGFKALSMLMPQSDLPEAADANALPEKEKFLARNVIVEIPCVPGR